MTAPPRELCTVVTCMGRLELLRRTLPRVLAGGSLYCLVDYSCPDDCSQWASDTFPLELSQGRLLVTRVPGRATFHKAAALNAGARKAMEAGADYLCFLDADTLPLAGFESWLRTFIAPDRFLICPTGRSLFGFLVVPANDFERLGGYDEALTDYGGEDVEMRLRLYLLGGLAYGSTPAHVLTGLSHSDELRARHYVTKDIRASNLANLEYVRAQVRQWTGRDVLDWGPEVTRLYHHDPKRPMPPGPALVSAFAHAKRT